MVKFEALSLFPSKIYQFDGKPFIEIMGKGERPRLVFCPESLAKELIAFARNKRLNSKDRFFRFNRTKGWFYKNFLFGLITNSTQIYANSCF